ncbi:hypothetical protein [Streptomyces sp. R08]|uniref:Protein kinase domain-containing protein n=1 Tax=Streptomyces sp. R08 TaxID=3238624 RepID=A0AB39MF32_9ACTN
MAGTFATVAPEVLATGMCSVASDVYSLAATAFYLLSGQYPNGPVSLGMTARRDRIINGQFDKLRDIAPQISQSLGAVIERGLSQSPEGRPRSAQEFANQLARCSLHRRAWRRIAPHNGHDLYFKGDAVKSAKEVTVCVLLDAHGRSGIEVRSATGRHLRQHEKNSIPPNQVSAALRSLFRRL